MDNRRNESRRMPQDKKIFRSSLALVAAYGLVSAFLNLLLGIVAVGLGLTRTPPGMALAHTLMTVISVLLPAVGFSWFCGGIRRCTATEKRLPVIDDLLLGVFGVGMCVTLNFIVTLLGTFLPFLGGESGVQVGLDPLQILLYTGAMAAVPALCEEIAFRGFALGALQKNGVWFAAVASSAVFGMLHGSLSSAVFAFLSGILFARLRQLSGRLLLPMIVHFINNALAVFAAAAASAFSPGVYQSLYLGVLILGLLLMLSAFVVLQLRRVRVFSAGGDKGLPLRQKLQYTFSCPVFDGFLIITLLLKFL